MLAGTFLAAIMLAWPVVMAAARAAPAPTFTAATNMNQTAERITADPGAPTGLTATPGDGRVTLAWAAPASDGGPQVTSYDVYAATSADFSAGTLVESSASTAATVSGLADGTTYYFWVTAVNAVGHDSAPSAEV